MNSPHAESAVRQRYAAAALAPEALLCCPVDYDRRLLEAIPAEVVEKDYGCGDPSRWLRPGETVLDLGSGTGKIAFIASQVVGPAGRVIGVDMTDAMLEVARRNAPVVASRVGFANVEFRRGRIQDLALDLDALDAALRGSPVDGVDAFLRLHEMAERLRRERPLVADASVDVVVSNCVLNLVDARDKRRLFAEIHRVLRPGGRAVISDIVCDEDVPEAMQRDAELWSGCISGALREDLFVRAFEEAGFRGIRLLKRDAVPWRTVEGIEFRAVTVEAFRGDDGTCREQFQAVVYKGPFREVVDDEGHRLRRGERTAVCGRMFEEFRRAPYAEHFEFVEPRVAVAAADAAPFPCGGTRVRTARETKGDGYRATSGAGECCGGGTCG